MYVDLAVITYLSRDPQRLSNLETWGRTSRMALNKLNIWQQHCFVIFHLTSTQRVPWPHVVDWSNHRQYVKCSTYGMWSMKMIHLMFSILSCFHNSSCRRRLWNCKLRSLKMVWIGWTTTNETLIEKLFSCTKTLRAMKSSLLQLRDFWCLLRSPMRVRTLLSSSRWQLSGRCSALEDSWGLLQRFVTAAYFSCWWRRKKLWRACCL